MSKQKVKGEKIQIVAFSTNETDHNPNDLINIYLENNNHLIIKKTSLRELQISLFCFTFNCLY